MNRVLIVGGYGLLGNDIYHIFKKKGLDVVRLPKEQLNLLNTEQIELRLRELQPDVVIHAAGYTDVERAELETKKVIELNCIGTFNLINALKYYGIKLVFISTDYVFNGKKKLPYMENDPVCPLNYYGWSKVFSENLINANYDKSYIVRTSWLFGTTGRNFPKIIIEKLHKGGCISVIQDQVGCPTYTVDLATSIISLISLPYGTYHITNSGNTSWYDFAKLIARTMKLDQDKIIPVNSATMNFLAERPSYSVLDNSKWVSSSNLKLPHYVDAINDFLININYME